MAVFLMGGVIIASAVGLFPAPVTPEAPILSNLQCHAHQIVAVYDTRNGTIFIVD